MHSCRDDAWTPVTDRRLRALLGPLTHNLTRDVPSVMYFLQRHAVHIPAQREHRLLILQ
jgi:hypothetical protein